MNNYQYLEEENKAEIDFGYIIILSISSAVLWTFLFWVILGVILGKKTDEFGCFLSVFLGSAIFSFFTEVYRVKKIKKQLGIK